MNNKKKILAENIRVILARKGWSQADLARKMGLKPQSIAPWMTEKSYPASKNLRMIANSLGVSIDQLTGVQTEIPKAEEDIRAILGHEHKVLLTVLEKSFAAILDERIEILKDLRDKIVQLSSLLEKVIKNQQK